MIKHLCDICKKEITMKSAFSVEYGKITDEDNGIWVASVLDTKELCRSCYNKILKSLSIPISKQKKSCKK